MADIAAGDVTYTEQTETVYNVRSFRHAVWKIEFGDGVDTYPSGGVPLTKGSLHCPTDIIEFYFIDANDANGFVYKYDYENDKIRIYQGDNNSTLDGALVELGGGSATPAATTLYCKVVGY